MHGCAQRQGAQVRLAGVVASAAGGNARQRVGGREDGNVADGGEREEMAVAGNDGVGACDW